MSDEFDYQSANEPNEAELMKVFDDLLPAPSALQDFLMQEALAAEPSILDLQLQQAAERMDRRRVDAEGRGVHPSDAAAIAEFKEWRQTVTPASPLERFSRLSDPAKQTVIDALQKAKASEVKRSTDDPVIPPPSDLRPEDVDRMIDEAWAKPGWADDDIRSIANTALVPIREAIAMLREMPEDRIFRQALTNLEMAAIGVAMRGQKDG